MATTGQTLLYIIIGEVTIGKQRQFSTPYHKRCYNDVCDYMQKISCHSVRRQWP